MQRSEGPGEELGWTFCLEKMEICRITGVDERTGGRGRWKKGVCEEKSCRKTSPVISRHCRKVDVLIGEQVSATGLCMVGWDSGSELWVQNRAPIPKGVFTPLVPMRHNAGTHQGATYKGFTSAL